MKKRIAIILTAVAIITLLASCRSSKDCPAFSKNDNPQPTEQPA